MNQFVFEVGVFEDGFEACEGFVQFIGLLQE